MRRTLEDFHSPTLLGPAVRDVTLYSPRGARLNLPVPTMNSASADGRFISASGEGHPRRSRMDAGTQFVEHARLKDRSVVGGYHSTSRWVRIVTCRRRWGEIPFASALGLDENREWIVGVEEVLENVPLEGKPRFHCFLDPRLAPGYLAWAVHDGEQVHLGVGGYPARFDPVKALREFRSSLDDLLDLSKARLIERRGGRIPVGGVLRRIANVEGLLIGDAAGAVSPLTAGGLDPCMRLSSFAAKVIAAYLATGMQRVEASRDLFRRVLFLSLIGCIAAVESRALWSSCALSLTFFSSLLTRFFAGSFLSYQLHTQAVLR